MKLHAQLHAQLHAHSQSISHPHVDVCLHWHVQWRLHVCCMHTYITGMHACRHTRKRAWTHPCTQHMQYCLQHMHCIAFAQYKHDTLTRMTLMTWHAWHTRPTLHMQHAWHAWYAWHAWHAWHARRTQHTRPTRATLQRPLCHFQEHHTVCFNFLFVRKQEYSRSEALDRAVVQQCSGTDSPRWKVKNEHTHYTHMTMAGQDEHQHECWENLCYACGNVWAGWPSATTITMTTMIVFISGQLRWSLLGNTQVVFLGAQLTYGNYRRSHTTIVFLPKNWMRMSDTRVCLHINSNWRLHWQLHSHYNKIHI